MTQNVLVTGSSGYLGENLTKELLKQGFRVVGCSRTNVSDKTILKNSNFSFKMCDITSKIDMTKIFESYKIDVVVHLAAHISFNDGELAEIQRILDVNIGGILNLLETMVNFNTKKLIYPSSMAVIGMPQYLPVDENHPCNPLSFYGLSKKLSEECIAFFSSKDLINSIILRFPGIFDEKRKSGAIFNFVSKALENKDITIELTKPIIWDVIHIKDAIDAILRGVNLVGDVHGSEIFNVGYGERIEIEEIAKRIVKMTGSKSKIKKSGNAKSIPFFFDTRKAKKFLGIRFPSMDDRLKQIITKLKKDFEVKF